MFATMHPDAILFMVIIGVFAVIYGLVQLYLICYHPDIFKRQSEQQHERHMAWQERQREKEAARRARNGKAMDAGVGLLKLFFGKK